MKKVLLINWNKLPVGLNKQVEGSGLRWWRIAQGLKEQPGLKVTLATWHENYIASEDKDSISFVSWGENETSDNALVRDHDAIILPMSMSGYTNKIMAYATSRQQLILDAYAPFYVEAATRSNSKKDDSQNDSWYEGMVWAGNESLINADYIMYASDSQRMFYEGLLSGLGALGPKYAERERFIHFPGAVEENFGVETKKTHHGKLKLLWFGALYPWYDIGPLLEAIAMPKLRDRIELTIVGGSNPMYAKDNLRFNGNYISAVEKASDLGVKDTAVKFIDWVSYGERLEFFKSADAAISLNAHTLENKYSWRIRVNDLAGNGVPVITNGGDPLGELLIKEGAAIRIDIGAKKSIAELFMALIDDSTLLVEAFQNLSRIHPQLMVGGYARSLADVIKTGRRPRLLQPEGDRSFIIKSHDILRRIGDENERKLSKYQDTVVRQSQTIDSLQKYIDELPKTIKQQIKKSIIYRIKHARKK